MLESILEMDGIWPNLSIQDIVREVHLERRKGFLGLTSLIERPRMTTRL